MKRNAGTNETAEVSEVKVGGLVVTRGFVGPLPSPETLARYEKILPGSAERVFALTEAQVRHRHMLESTLVSSDVKNARTGLIFGFLIGVLGIAGGLLAAVLGREDAGAFVAALSLGSLVATFVYGTRERRKERVSEQAR